MPNAVQEVNIQNNYRNDILGLRGIAVLGVIIYHFNKSVLPSGFLGVDIFFAISGYVITSSLFKNNFSNFSKFLLSFYNKRFQRLFPALVLYVLIFSLLISFFDPDPQFSLRTGFTSLFGVSNLYLFKQSSDYFSQSSDLNIFNNTWSLGIESQFYLIFPFVFWFTGLKRGNSANIKFFVTTLSIVSIASLINFVYFYQTNNPYSYLLISSRFWEIASGSISFLISQNKTFQISFLTKLPTFPIFLILVGLFWMPIIYAPISTLFTIILTNLLILNTGKDDYIYKFLTNSILKILGLISYSLYLWHWGILSLSRWTIGITWWTIPLQIVLIFIFSYLSFRYLEIPFRRKDPIRIRNSLLIGKLIPLFAAIFSLVLLDGPLKEKLFLGKDLNVSIIKNPLDTKTDSSKINYRECYFSESASKNDPFLGNKQIDADYLKRCAFINKENDSLISFIGDSQTSSTFPLINNLTNSVKFDTFFYSKGNCPFPSIKGEDELKRGCFNSMKNVQEFILEQTKTYNDSLIVSNLYLNLYFGKATASNTLKAFRNNPNLVNEYLDSLKLFLQELKKYNASFVLFYPTPEFKDFVPQFCTEQWFRSKSQSKKCLVSNAKKLRENRIFFMKELEKLALEESNFYIFDAFSLFCDNNNCKSSINGEVMFMDEYHLSIKGANYLGKFFNRFLIQNNLIQ